MSIIEKINELDNEISELVSTEGYVGIVSRLKDLYAKHFKKNQIWLVENGHVGDRYPSSYTDENFIFESGYLNLDDEKAEEVKNKIVKFCQNFTE